MASVLDALSAIDPADNIRVISFDVFDTLLVRSIDPPEVIKGKAAAFAVRELGLAVSDRELLRLRKEAEHEVTRGLVDVGADGECSLADVYAAVAGRLGVDESLGKRLLDCEFAVEKAYCSPVPHAEEMLSRLSRSHRLVAVSDTYLPKELLVALLESCGLARYFSNVYPSCHYGLNKGSGRLFQKVLELEGIEAGELLHVGDNFLGDYFSPRRLGIQALLLRDRANLRRRAGLAACRAMASGSPSWRDASLAATLCSTPTHPDRVSGALYLWGRTVVGPLLANFTHLLCLELQQSQPDAVLFVAREGYLLQKLYRLFSSRLFGGVHARAGYLCVSRYTAFLAALSQAGRREVEVAFSEFSVSLDAALARFGIADRTAVQHLLQRHGWRDEDEASKEAVRALVLRLLDDADFQLLVAEASRQMRDGLHGHLASLGFFDCSNVALVDVGWFGGIQDSLERSLSGEGDIPSLHGYYLALEGSPLYASENKIGLLHDFRRSTPDGASLGFFKLAFEFSCRAPHGTTVGYLQRPDGVTVPHFREDARERRSNADILEIQRGILDCARDYLAVIQVEKVDPHSLSLPLLKEYSSRISFPDRAMAAALGRVVNTEDFGSPALREISANLRLIDLLTPKSFLTRLVEIPWREAALDAIPIPGLLAAFCLVKRLMAHRRIGSDRKLSATLPQPPARSWRGNSDRASLPLQLLRHRLFLYKVKATHASIAALIAALRPLPPKVSYRALLGLVELKRKAVRLLEMKVTK